MMKKVNFTLLLLACLFNFKFIDAQVVINEYVPANISGIVNGNASYNDWIELYNAGSSSVNLLGYQLSDNVTDLAEFTFPSYNLAAGGYVLVFAADTTNKIPVDHWENVVTSGTTWKYYSSSTLPDTNWRNNSFSDAAWSSGPGGMGFGDGDDGTTISTSSQTVLMRKSFTLTASDTANILKSIFNVDYDDGFVAYLNGVEIARANLGSEGVRPAYTDFAISSHEAVMYQGGKPDSFFVKPSLLKTILRVGSNILSVEVHNQTPSSNDMTAKPYLHFGMKNPGITFSNPSPFFGNPGKEYFSAKFKLSRSGETIYLADPSSTILDQQSYSNMGPDNSYGRKPDGSSNWCLMENPTPNASNNSATCYSGYAIQPVFSVGPGFYPATQHVTISNATPGGVIRYTINGDDPKPTSPAYSGPLNVSSTRTIRAKIFASGYLPSKTITNTYVINEDVKLPVFSITTDSLNLWDYNTGIYVLGPNAQPTYPFKDANFWQDWSKPATIEYFDKSKNQIFNFDADISIYGNYSRAQPQKSLEINMKDKYGTGEVNYVFIPDKPFISTTNNIVLRNSGTDWNEVHFRDAFMERVMKKTHSGYVAAEPAVMYLNGSYWGVFTIHENHDHHWIENNFHYKEDEIDYMREFGSTIEVKNGTDGAFWNSYNYATTQDTLNTNYYSDMNNLWDLNNYKDYFIAETYYDNGDWIGDWTNNIKFWRPNKINGKLRYILYDTDFGLGLEGSWTSNRLDQAIHPAALSYSSNIFKSMLGNPQFKREFINRYADLINTTFLPSEMFPVMHQFQDSMAHDMQSHFAKWGSTIADWQTRINTMINFINLRPARVRTQIQSEFALTKQVTLTFNVSPAGAGRIEVSTVVPTTYPWTGIYFDGNPVTITAIPNPGYTFNHWNSNHAITNDLNQVTTYNFSDVTESITAFFTGTSQPALLTVSEFNYNSDTTIDASDWIELHNYGTTPLNLTGWTVKDEDDNSEFIFPTGTTIPANGYLVLMQDSVKFRNAYPLVTNAIGILGFNLGNSGDQVRVFSPGEQLYLSFYFQDLLPWPVQADGQGYTCELSSNTANLNDGASWSVGCIGGSPGRGFSNSLATSTHVAGNTTFCSGGHSILSVNTNPGFLYQWQHNHVDIPTATDTVYNATQTGAYTVRVLFQGCSSVSDTLNVVLVSSAQSPVTTTSSRCGDGPVTLSATATDSIYWFNTPGGTIVGAGPTFVTPIITHTTTYYAQASLSCPSQAVAVDATIRPYTATPVASNVTRCGPGAAVVTANDTATIHWYNDQTGGALIFTGNVFVTGYIPHDTIFYAEAGTQCVSERVPVTVSVTSSLPPVVDTVARCGPGALVLNAISAAPVFWYDSVVAGNQVGSGINFLTPSLSANKTYYAESNSGCASARVASLAMVNTIPASPVSADSSYCGDGSVILYATSPVQIFWYDQPSGGTALASGSYFSSPVISTTTTYYAESFDICSSTRTPVNAVIVPLPSVFIGNDTTISTGNSVTLDAGAGFDSYQWSNGATTQSINVSTSDTFVVAVGQNNCIGTDTIVIRVLVGIQEASNMNTAINIYPNPVNGLMNIQLTSEKNIDATITLIDITGKQLKKETMHLINGINSYLMDVSEIAEGVYFLNIKSDQYSKTMSVTLE